MTASEAQSGATWGLDRVDQTALPLDDVYRYPDNGGQGVNVYIIDTGITAAHTEFTGRIGNCQNFASNSDGLLGGLLGGLLPIRLPSLGGLSWEEIRVGKVGVGPCGSRWWGYHYTKK